MTYFVLCVLLTETAEKTIYKTNNFMKKIVFILPLMALLVTGCQKNNILKVTLTEAEACDQFIKRHRILCYDKGDAHLELVDSKKMGNKVTLVYNSLITEIGDGDFLGSTSLKSIEIPDSVTEIGNGAFWGCESLRSVKIPKSVTKIGHGAFEGCEFLKSIKIPDFVTEIRRGAFCGCVSLRSVKIPKSVTEIGDYAFAGCTSLKSIEIPDSVTEIGNEAFAECTSLKKVRMSRNTGYRDNSFPEDVEIIAY